MMHTDCPRCGAAGRLIPAGVSNTTGNAYGEFMACDTCRSGTRNLTWTSEKQWKFHQWQASKSNQAGTSEPPPRKEKAPAPKKVPAPRPLSPTVQRVIFANKLIEKLNTMEAADRVEVLKPVGFDPNVDKSFVLFINAMDNSHIDTLAKALGV